MSALWVTAGLAAPFPAAQRPTLSKSRYHFHCPEAPWTRLMGPPHQLLMPFLVTLTLACGAPIKFLAYSFLPRPWRRPHFHVSPHYISVWDSWHQSELHIANSSLSYFVKACLKNIFFNIEKFWFSEIWMWGMFLHYIFYYEAILLLRTGLECRVTKR